MAKKLHLLVNLLPPLFLLLLLLLRPLLPTRALLPNDAPMRSHTRRRSASQPSCTTVLTLL